jgi:hypothetical protein
LLQSIQLQWGSSLAHLLMHCIYGGNHGHHDCQVALVFGRIQWSNKMILVLRVMLGICSWVTRMTQISGSTRLVPEVLHTFRHQLYVERDVTAAFVPHPGQPLAQGLIIVMTLVANMALIL